jgi:2-polyprenyl-3-methyl-5-hydroxy-6-metoxy-1,4-benzoquinol methylase
MEAYKARIYEQYYKKHIVPRKGNISIAELDRKLKVFGLHFGFVLPKDKTIPIVDAGCGNGSLVYWLQKSGYTNACGVDGSIDQIEAGQNLGIQNLQVGNLVDYLTANPGRFEVIFLRDVLEHFAREDVLPLLDICRSALKPGGRIVIQVPNGASPCVGRVLYGDFTHEVAFTESSLSQLLLITGFEELKVRPYLPYFPLLKFPMLFSRKGRGVIVRKLAWMLVRRLYALMLFAEIGRHNTVLTFNLIATAIRSE